MALKKKSLSEHSKNATGGVITVIHGTPDSGKSTILQTLSKNNKMLYVDVEDKLNLTWPSIPDANKNEANIDIPGNEIMNLKDAKAILTDPDAAEYDVIAIDSVSYLVALATAHTNPSKLAGNGVFSYYRELGADILFIMEEAKKRKINLVLTFQSTDQSKNNKGTWIPSTEGNEIAGRIRELADVMIFIEKTGFGKRRAWLDTSDDFALTKSKLLPADHLEKIDFEGLEEFSMDTILGSRPLPKKMVSKCTPAQATEIGKLIKAGNKLEEIDMDALLGYLGIKGVDLADISEEKAAEMIGLLKERNEDVKEQQKIAKKAERKSAPKKEEEQEDAATEGKAVKPEDEPATAEDLKMEKDA